MHGKKSLHLFIRTKFVFSSILAFQKLKFFLSVVKGTFETVADGSARRLKLPKKRRAGPSATLQTSYDRRSQCNTTAKVGLVCF